MLTLRKSQDRGHFNHGWLDTYHTFSFGDYRDPQHVHFSTLRVINEDRVAPGQGFGTHPHRDMEIITYVLSGALEHRDSLGNGSVIRPGDVQHMSAGRGITHSEFNPSATEPVHLLQIWIMPNARSVEPGYSQKAYSVAERENQLRLVASLDGRAGSLNIHQDANVFASLLDAGKSIKHALGPGRSIWIQVARGTVSANGTTLSVGDGAAITGESELQLVGLEAAELLVFDLA